MTPRRILVGGWIVFLLYAYPGYLMSDGADQLVDSRYGSFTDWHSPMLTELWRLVEHLIGGPFGMLVLQSLLLLLGAHSIARSIVSDRASAWVALAVLLAPPLLVTNAIVSAEPQLGAWLVAGLALLLSERFSRRLIGLAMLVIAAGLHAGASAAVLPVILATFTWSTEQARWRRVGIALAAWMIVVLTAGTLNRILVDTPSQRDDIRLAMDDIVGILARAPTIDDARALALMGDAKLTSPEGIQTHAKALYGKELTYGTGDKRLFEAPDTEAARDALLQARRAFVRAYPRAYLAVRWSYFYRALGLRRPGTWNPVYTNFVEAPRDSAALHHAGRHSLVQRILIVPVRALRNTFVFRPVYYLALTVLLLGFAIWKRRRIEIILLTAGIAYEITWMLSMTRIKFIDSHLMLLTTLLAAFLLIARRVAPKPSLEPRNEGVDRDAPLVIASDHQVER